MPVFKKKLKEKWILKAVFLGAILLLGTMSRGAELKETNPSQPSNAATPELDSTETDPPADKTPDEKDLTQLSLETLTGLNVKVTSSSKKAESLRDATSAIYVITSEDIRRSGFQHLADLLRMVPGVQDNQNNASEWGISARGFNAQHNNKMLVLVDGRSVFASDWGGVNWRELDLLLEDIDRIEVIRGPGGTLWGSNAVNGVINIITKDAKVTQGLYVTGIRGSLIDGTDAFHYGSKAGEVYYRIYAKKTEALASQSVTGGDWHDAWNDQRTGFRGDWHGEKDQVTFQGDYQQGRFDYQADGFDPVAVRHFTDLNTNFEQDGNLLVRWVRTLSDTSEAELQASYEKVHIQTNDGQTSARDTLNSEFQHRFHLNDRNEITWGMDFKNVADQYQLASIFYFPNRHSESNFGTFLQDKWTVIPDRVYLTGGSKWEIDDDNNVLLPSARLLWTPDSRESLWAAVSKAVRFPQRFQEDAYSFFDGTAGSPNTYSSTEPNSGLMPEELVAYELGYRVNPFPKMALDIAAFYNSYDHLIDNINSSAVLPSPIGGQIVNEAAYVNVGGGAIYGAEASAKWEVADNFKVSLGYSYQDYDNQLLQTTNSVLGVPPPHNLFNAQVFYKPLSELELNTAFYFHDNTNLYDEDPAARGILPSYTRWDLGATWKATPNLEVSVWGQNLQGTHTETLVSNLLQPTNIVPSVYGQLTARY